MTFQNPLRQPQPESEKRTPKRRSTPVGRVIFKVVFPIPTNRPVLEIETMEFEVYQSEDERYLIVKSFEDLTADIQRRMMQAVAEKMAEQAINAVLVDVSSVRNVATVHENFNFANYQAKQLNFPRHSRVAILVESDDHSHDFIETVFQNAGYSCRISQDEDSAIQWLTA